MEWYQGYLVGGDTIKILDLKMSSTFDPISTAEGWQISNAPIMGMAPLVTAMNIYSKAGMNSIREKGENISSYIEYLIHQLIPSVYYHTRG